ncbi:DNA-binding protein [Pararhizobium gei]|uniref:DNA-binding protein n=1 Tax=Pararhizobium gei TaxID=1395951 RepID=UPI0023DB7680|nr:DNA-binding protein [Rhizobium gei]
MFGNDSLELTVNVSASEWAYAQRRLTYLETLLLRIVRDKAHIQEWYDAAELAALRLPGLPDSKTGITRKATMGNWRRRTLKDRKGRRYVYHASSFPARAFDALIARLLDLPPVDADMDGVFALPVETPPQHPPMPENTAPVWVLPLMRLMKGEANGNLGRAWQALPAHLPKGIALPSVREAAEILVNLGLA